LTAAPRHRRVRQTAAVLVAILLPWAAARAADDLPQIRARGTLRILVVGGEDEPPIPRVGTPAALDRDLLEDFARRQGLRIQTVWIERRHDVLDDLLSGAGDVAATGITLTSERAARVAFTNPIDVVDEVLVGHRGMKHPPKKPADLAGRKVSIPVGSTFAATLVGLKISGLLVEQILSPVLQTELLDEVSRGERELTVADSNVLAAEQEWAKDAVPLFPLARKRPIAWALHPDAKELKAALDVFIQERSLVAHAERNRTGDLPEIKKRGVLRVLTRNNAVSYFLLRGEAVGFDHDLMKMFADQLEVRLQIVVPPRHEDLMPWLLQGRGDLVAASVTVTSERAKRVAFSVPYLEVQELLVQRASEPLLKSVADLKGRRIRARAGTTYVATLERLRAEGGAFTIELAPTDVGTEDLVDEVAAGTVDLTVSDSHVFQAERVWRSDVVAAFALQSGQKLAFAMRPADKQLKAALEIQTRYENYVKLVP
jgi:membrane-bound lytic murein transglycosylase F